MMASLLSLYWISASRWLREMSYEISGMSEVADPYPYKLFHQQGVEYNVIYIKKARWYKILAQRSPPFGLSIYFNTDET